MFVERPPLARNEQDDAAGFWAIYGSITRAIPLPTPELEVVERRRDLLPELPATDPGAAGYWRTLLERYADWSPDVMLRIINCESHFDENAVSPDERNVGAYQLNVVHGFRYEDMTDPSISTDLAHDVWLSQGYQAWSCY